MLQGGVCKVCKGKTKHTSWLVGQEEDIKLQFFDLGSSVHVGFQLAQIVGVGERNFLYLHCIKRRTDRYLYYS